MAKAPAFQFYAGDWLRDPSLRACSLAARGLWIDMLAYMHQSEPYGHLTVNGQPVTAGVLARLVGDSEKRVAALLAELEGAGVFSRRADDGAIYSRRMVRDEQVRRVRAEGGKLGGNPNLTGAGKVGGKVNLPPNLPPTPSSAICSLQSSNLEGQGQGRAPAGATRPRKSKPPATQVPDDFAPSDRVRAWATAKGFDRVDEHAEAFVRKCRAHGYAYADHDAALMEAIREDWAKLRANGAAPQVRAKEIPILPPGVKPPPGYLRSGLDKPQ